MASHPPERSAKGPNAAAGEQVARAGRWRIVTALFGVLAAVVGLVCGAGVADLEPRDPPEAPPTAGEAGEPRALPSAAGASPPRGLPRSTSSQVSASVSAEGAPVNGARVRCGLAECEGGQVCCWRKASPLGGIFECLDIARCDARGPIRSCDDGTDCEPGLVCCALGATGSRSCAHECASALNQACDTSAECPQGSCRYGWCSQGRRLRPGGRQPMQPGPRPTGGPPRPE